MPRILDEYDRKILKELIIDGRLTNNQLAEKIGLSKSPCWQRVKRLEEEGYIQGYTAILDQSRLGLNEIVMVEVTLERHDDVMLAGFEKAISQMPEILEAYLTTGEYDYFLKVAIDGTRSYEEFLRRKLYTIPGVRHTRSCFSLGCLKKSYSVVPDKEVSN